MEAKGKESARYFAGRERERVWEASEAQGERRMKNSSKASPAFL